MDNINEQLFRRMQEEIDTLRTLVEANAQTIQANGLTIQLYGEELRDIQHVVLAPACHRTGEEIVAEVQANKMCGMKRRD